MNILITGANRGIGLSFVKTYITNGHHVIACCRNPEAAKALDELKKKFNDQLEVLSLDLTNDESITQLRANLKNKPIDILINNAGIYRIDSQPLEKYSAWADVFKVNTIGPYILSKTLLPNISQGATKKIANISSYMASITYNDNGIEPQYRASKCALNAISKNLAIEFEPHGVAVFALDPGWVRTDMGGPDGLLHPDEAAIALIQQIDNHDIKDSGCFINYKGKSMPW